MNRDNVYLPVLLVSCVCVNPVPLCACYKVLRMFSKEVTKLSDWDANGVNFRAGLECSWHHRINLVGMEAVWVHNLGHSCLRRLLSTILLLSQHSCPYSTLHGVDHHTRLSESLKSTKTSQSIQTMLDRYDHAFIFISKPPNLVLGYLRKFCLFMVVSPGLIFLTCFTCFDLQSKPPKQIPTSKTIYSNRQLEHRTSEQNSVV